MSWSDIRFSECESSGAQAAGRARRLDPGETLETEVAFVLHEGLDRVTGVRRQRDTLAVERTAT